MKAIVYRTYGSPDVIQVEEVAAPVPRDSEVRIRIHASVVSGSDCEARKGDSPFARLYFGLRRPRFPVLGAEFAGVVDSAGSAVTKFRVGDPVIGVAGPRLGAHAEYLCVPENGTIVAKPAGLSDADVVAVLDGGLTALPFLRDSAHLASGQSILINGASGAVGAAAVQLARHFGAIVTAVCSTANLELVTSLGANTVIDYTEQDFTQSDQTYDVVFDAVGKSSFSRCRRLLKPGGIYLTTVPSLAILAQTLWTAKIGTRKAAIAFTGLRKSSDMAKDLVILGELAASGQYVPVIDQTYPLERASAAHAHVDTGHKRGSVVVTLA